MTDFHIRYLETTELPTILPLVQKLNPTLAPEVLSHRLSEMIPQGYRCVGIFDQAALVGISGIWVHTKFYCGKCIEPDNVFIEPDYRARGLGKMLLNWIYEEGQRLECDVSELNCYVTNTAGQRFWTQERYAILGFHYQKKLSQLKS